MAATGVAALVGPFEFQSYSWADVSEARLVDGVKPQKPIAVRPRQTTVPWWTWVAGPKTERQSPRLVRDENGTWVLDRPKAVEPVQPDQSCEGYESHERRRAERHSVRQGRHQPRVDLGHRSEEIIR